jgi:hypothetical protein
MNRAYINSIGVHKVGKLELMDSNLPQNGFLATITRGESANSAVLNQTYSIRRMSKINASLR